MAVAEQGRTVTQTIELAVQITITDESAITRITGPEGDAWRAQMYGDIKTEGDVLAHFAYNCIVNGIADASELDGWADLPKGAITMKPVAG